jgi:putative transposase
MKWLCHPLLVLLANSTESELAKQVEYLKAENAILRKRLPKCFHTTAEERSLLMKLGEAVGPTMEKRLTIVTYACYRKWIAQANGTWGLASGTYKKTGRPRTPEHIRHLVLRLARENGWGYTRILGELRKLGIKVSRSTVVNILRQNELDPKLDPTKGNWGEFFKVHARTLWQCDFFSKYIVTAKGIRQCFILAFLHVATRRVFLTPCTFKPDAAWMQGQAYEFIKYTKREGLPAEIVLRDRDCMYVPEFEDMLNSAGIELKRVAYRAPKRGCASRFCFRKELWFSQIVRR